MKCINDRLPQYVKDRLRQLIQTQSNVFPAAFIEKEKALYYVPIDEKFLVSQRITISEGTSKSNASCGGGGGAAAAVGGKGKQARSSRGRFVKKIIDPDNNLTTLPNDSAPSVHTCTTLTPLTSTLKNVVKVKTSSHNAAIPLADNAECSSSSSLSS